MRCPACKLNDDRVIDSRQTNEISIDTTRRRRECNRCKHRWTTYEVTQEFVEDLRKGPCDIIKIGDKELRVSKLVKGFISALEEAEDQKKEPDSPPTSHFKFPSDSEVANVNPGLFLDCAHCGIVKTCFPQIIDGQKVLLCTHCGWKYRKSLRESQQE